MNFLTSFTKKIPDIQAGALSYRPSFFRLNNTKDAQSLQDLLDKKPFISLYDTLEAQLRELVKSLYPADRLTAEALEKAVKDHLNGIPLPEYGVWVYYPWSERLVHLLDEEEYTELRTNRNLYKITREERETLSQKKIGVIGLSVGQSVALTLAMERSFGELRIADFDILELSNLNRIRTGAHNLGVSKVITVAREIAEIDPYLKITCFHEGITEENIKDFFLNGGKLDILVDECDSLVIKIACRQYARIQKVPVLMDTSDKGMLDIERFDTEPDRPLFHGLIEEKDLPGDWSSISPEQRMKLTLNIVGGETISDRMKFSIAEIGKTISTWPQLASSVLHGGAVTAQACRLLALGKPIRSGRFYIDAEQVII